MPLGQEDIAAIAKAKAENKVNLAKATALIDVNKKYDSTSEPRRGAQDNPQFIWPGTTARDMGVGTYRPVRGYIRRLNEFYKNMSDDKTAASQIINRRCNFQIQPDSIIRNVSANAIDTQFFFNQDPAQLSVPIPGQSTYTLTLLFNREPEVASGKYMVYGALQDGEPRPKNFNGLTSDMSSYITGDFKPSWVTRLGVFVDIMVLDAVIGQGINADTLKTIQGIAKSQEEQLAADIEKNKAILNDPKYKDERDKATAAAAAAKSYWANTDDNTNPNIGNTAFLVPTPVRIMMSNTMMIEGFVMSSNVNFHKFSRDFIPTQCRVDLQIQALYIGFAKNNTLLTTPIDISSGSGPDTTTKSTSELAVEKETLDSINKIYKSITHDSTGKDLIDSIVNKKEVMPYNFAMELTNEALAYFKNMLKPGGGNPEFYWDGTIKIYWEKHIVGASNPRTLQRTSASGGTLTGIGAPSSLTGWGTKASPLTLAAHNGKIYIFDGGTSLVRIHVIGKTEGLFSLYAQEVAQWPMTYPDDPFTLLPYEQDEFHIDLEITFKLKRNETYYKLGQKAVLSQIVKCGDTILQGITFEDNNQTQL